MKAIKNLPASIRQRLLNRSKNDNRPFNELLQYYAMERFLYRLSKSPFIEAKQIQWTAFWRRLQQDHVPSSFRDIVSALEGFLVPIASALSGEPQKPISWTAPGPWVLGPQGALSWAP